MKSRTKIIIGVLVVLVLGAIIFASIRSQNKEGTPVTFAKVERQDLTSKVSANGQIDAQRKVDLSANVMGQIVNLAVREGDVVKKGDFLLQIDQKQLAASAQGAEASMRALFSDRDAARASLSEADSTYQRARNNFAQQIIPAAELDRGPDVARRSTGERHRHRTAHPAGAVERDRGARHAVEDHHDRPDGRHHHRIAGRRRRGRRDRHHEQRRHQAAHHRRHERGRSG